MIGNQMEQSPRIEQGNIADKYSMLDQARLGFEADGRAVADQLKELLLSDNPEQSKDKINKLAAFLELDEESVASIERDMVSLEYRIGHKSGQSERYDNYENDILVNSAIFYNQRIDRLRDATGDTAVDEPFVKAITEYSRAIERHVGPMSLRYDDIADRQDFIEQTQIGRSRAHNRMIAELNKLNDLALENKLKPLTYRNLIQNSEANNFENDEWMYHDRVSAARYASLVALLASDNRFPNPKSLKEA